MPQRYSIHAEGQSLFAFLKQTFSQMPIAIRVFAYLVFLFLFSFLTLYEFLGITYYEGQVIYVYRMQGSGEIKEGYPPQLRIVKGKSTTTNEHGEFFMGIHSMIVPFMDVDFDFEDSSSQMETVSIPAPVPIVSLFNPNERAIYYVPGNTVKDPDGGIRHYFLGRREAREALKKSLQASSQASSALPPTTRLLFPGIVHAGISMVRERSYYLTLRQFRLTGRGVDGLDVYFEVTVDGSRVRVDRLPTVDSSELSHIEVSRDEPYHFSDVTVAIPESAHYVEIAVFQHRSFLQKDIVVGSVGLQPKNTGVGDVTLSGGSIQIDAQLSPPISIATASVAGKKGTYIVAFALDIPSQYLSKVRSLQYDLGPSFESGGRIVRPPTVDPSDYFAYAVSIDAAQPIDVHIDLNGAGGSLDVKAFLDLRTTAFSPMEHNLLARAESIIGSHTKALDEVNKALLASPDFVPALIQKGVILAELKHFDESVIALRQALQLDPNNATALNAYAWIIADDLPRPTREQLDEARVRIQRAIAISPDPSAYDTEGWVQFKLGNYREAVDALEQAKRGQSGDRLSTVWQEINFHLGMAYIPLGKNGEAREAFQEVVNFGQQPTSKEKYVQQAKTHLVTLQARLTPDPR